MTSQKLASMTIATCALLFAQPAIAGDKYGDYQNDGEYYADGTDVQSYDRKSNDRYGERITRHDNYNGAYDEGYEDSQVTDKGGYKDDYVDRRPDHRYGSYKDDPGHQYEPPRATVPRYRPRKFRRHAHPGCIPRRLIRRSLRHNGWRRIRFLGVRGPVIRVKARNRRRGGRYVLALDRCTGEVIAARPMPRFHKRWRRFSRFYD